MPARERWRMIPGFGECYLVSDLGRVLSLKQSEPNYMCQVIASTGYPQVQLSHDNKTFNRHVHRLVAEAFHGPCPEGYECRHLNGDKTDNRALNLLWGTQSENSLDRVRHGTHHWAAKTHCPQGHPYDANNTYRRPSKPNARECRACARDRGHRNALRAASVPSSAAA